MKCQAFEILTAKIRKMRMEKANDERLNVRAVYRTMRDLKRDLLIGRYKILMGR